ncbi:MAG: uridine kinase [Bacteroidota bacterium]
MKTLIIGIAGGSGSGKTTVTKNILAEFGKQNSTLIQHDSYYRNISTYADKNPAHINFDHPDSLETSLLIKHLQSLKKGKSAEIPIYDYSVHSRKKESRKISATKIIIVEGILIFVNEALRNLFDLKIYIDTDADERIMRRIRRDTQERGRTIESVIQQYSATVKPMHLQFVEPTKNWSDIIIPHGGENEIAIDVVVRAIKSLINKK